MRAATSHPGNDLQVATGGPDDAVKHTNSWNRNIGMPETNSPSLCLRIAKARGQIRGD